MTELTRRRVLQGTGAIGAASLAGCVAGYQGPQQPAEEELQEAAAVDVDRIAADPTDVPPPVDWDEPREHETELTTTERTAEVEPGVTFDYMTFEDQVPGPMLRVRRGDPVTLSLTSGADSAMPHNIDIHAVYGPGGGAEDTTVTPGETATIRFKAMYPGVFIYHCAVPNMDQHISAGMFGAILVEPEDDEGAGGSEPRGRGGEERGRKPGEADRDERELCAREPAGVQRRPRPDGDELRHRVHDGDAHPPHEQQVEVCGAREAGRGAGDGGDADGNAGDEEAEPDDEVPQGDRHRRLPVGLEVSWNRGHTAGRPATHFAVAPNIFPTEGCARTAADRAPNISGDTRTPVACIPEGMPDIPPLFGGGDGAGFDGYDSSSPGTCRHRADSSRTTTYSPATTTSPSTG